MLIAQRTGRWTLAELDRLPTDSNKYELVDGELFVTPAPSHAHERLATVLHGILFPYVLEHRLGSIYRPRAVIRTSDSEVEPDLMVRPDTAQPEVKWESVPMPSLVVEVLSRTTGRRDKSEKRTFYLRCGIPEYWIVDGVQRCIRVITSHSADVVEDQQLLWRPLSEQAPLAIDVVAYFREALG